jgi:vacuolar-type H+-ATPase subunit D/Vma8
MYLKFQAMTKEDAKEAIKNIPIGAKIQIIQKSGNIMDVRLSSHEVNKTEEKRYEMVTVPELPPALLVHGHIRQGNYRIELEDIVRIAWVED